MVEERRVDRFADDVVAAERERQVGDPATHLHPGAGLFDDASGRQKRLREFVVLFDAGGDGEDVGIEDDVLRGKANLLGEDAVGAPAYLDFALDGFGLTLLVEGHHHHRGAVAAHEPGILAERFFALLQADRVDDALALHALEPRLDYRPLRAVDHDRHASDLRLGGDEMEKRRHRLLGIEQAFVHVHVDQVGAAAHLIGSHRERPFVVLALDQPGEALRARDVGALADRQEAGLGTNRQDLEAGEAQQAIALRPLARGKTLDRSGDLADVVGRRAAAAADDVQPAPFGELAKRPRRVIRRLVVAAEYVRQPGVRVAAHPAGGECRELLDVGPHAVRAERAVDADAEGIRVRDRRPERFDRLRRQRAAAFEDRRRQPDRQPHAALGEHLLDREDRRLHVGGVKGRLGEQQIDAAVDEPAHLLGVGVLQLIEGDGPEARVVHAPGDRQRSIGRPDRAGHEPRLSRIACAVLAREANRDLGRRYVQVIDLVAEAIVGLRDAVGVERVGLDDVGAGLEIGAVDLLDHVGAGDHQQVVIALQVVGMIDEAPATVIRLAEAVALDHRPPRAVENEDALGKQPLERPQCVRISQSRAILAQKPRRRSCRPHPGPRSAVLGARLEAAAANDRQSRIARKRRIELGAAAEQELRALRAAHPARKAAARAEAGASLVVVTLHRRSRRSLPPPASAPATAPAGCRARAGARGSKPAPARRAGSPERTYPTDRCRSAASSASRR